MMKKQLLVACALIFLVPSLAQSEIQRLMHYFPFDTAIREILTGAGPSNEIDGVQLAEGRFGKSLQLDGQGYLEIPINLRTDRTPAITVMAWVKVDPRPTDVSPTVRLPGSVEIIGGFIGVSNLNSDKTYFYGRSLGRTLKGDTPDVFRDQWQHVAVTRRLEDRPDKRSGDVKPHVVSTFFIAGRPGVERVDLYRGNEPSQTLYIGKANPRRDHSFRGSIDELRIYNRELAGDEIKAVANGRAALRQAADSQRVSGIPDDAVRYGSEGSSGEPGEDAELPAVTLLDPPEQDDNDSVLPSGSGNTSGTQSMAPGVIRPIATPVEAVTETGSDQPARLPGSRTGIEGSELPTINGAPNLSDSTDVTGSPSVPVEPVPAIDSLTDVPSDETADWRIVGVLPLSDSVRAGIYPGSTITLTVRVQKTDPANAMPKASIVVGNTRKIVSIKTSAAKPTLSRDFPLPITVSENVTFNYNQQVVSYSPNIQLRAENGGPLRDANPGNNSPVRFAVPVNRPQGMASEDCGGGIERADGTRSTSSCLQSADRSLAGIYVDTSVLVFAETGFSQEHANDAVDLLVFENGQDFVTDITVTENSADRPCIVRLAGHLGGDQVKSICKNGNGDELYGVRVDHGHAVVGRRVCRNRANHRLKGMQIQTRQVNPDGTLSLNSTTQEPAKLANCSSKRWSRFAQCGGGQVAAGIRMRISPNGYFHSLDLACGLVKVRGAN